MSTGVTGKGAGVVERIRAAMNAAKLNQRQLAERSGVNYRTLQEYLSGRNRIPADVLPGLARTLDVSTDWLLMGVPASLHPGILRVALSHTRHLPSGADPASADFAGLLYMTYCHHYCARFGKIPDLDNEIRAFIDRLKDESGPHIISLLVTEPR